MKRDEIQIRDPFIYTHEGEGKYYLYGTTDKNPWNQRGVGFDAYVSTDLETFEGPHRIFTPPGDFWGTHDFWAPELHSYRGKFYLFASFTSDSRRRGTQILVSDSLLGPFLPLAPGPVTPPEWECLDGTLFVDDREKPWMVFCHEWVQIHDGAVCAVPLSDDLSHPVGEPRTLFHASAAPWSLPRERKDGSGICDARVTDGPFMHRQKDGTLVMLWSSFGSQGYAMGCALSESGDLSGPWRQMEKPVVTRDGGHGMIFRDLSGQLQITWHSPNTTPLERFVYQGVRETAEGISL